MSFGERITRAIIEAETVRAGEVLYEGLAERLAVYIDEQDRARFLADAEKAIGQPVTEIYDAFLALLPIDCDVVNGIYGMKLRLWTAPTIWKRGNVSRVRA